MEYSQEVLEMVKNSGAMSYPIERLCEIVEVDNLEQFRKDFFTVGSIIEKNYRAGKYLSEYVVDCAVMDLAQAGDQNAIKTWRGRKRLFEEGEIK
jgi:hypothetical protein